MPTNRTVLYVGADSSDRTRRVGTLKARGHTVLQAANAREGLLRLRTESVDGVICSGSLRGMSVLQFQNLVHSVSPGCPVFVVGDLEAVSTGVFSGGSAIQYVPDEWGLADVVEESLARRDVDASIEGHLTLTATINTIAVEIATADSIGEVKRNVYDRLAALDRFQFVWLGTYDEDTDQFTIEVPSETTMATDQFAVMVGATEAEFIRRAASSGNLSIAESSPKTRVAATAQSKSEETSPAPTMSEHAAVAQVTAAVPLSYKERVYGLLLLATSPRTDEPIGSAEREQLAGLGRVIGWALATKSSDPGLDSTDFAEVVVHELINPLALAMTAFERLEENPDPEHLETAERALTRIEHVLSDELALFRGEAPESLTVDSIEADASNAWETLDTKNADLTIDASFDFEADHALVESLLRNLFDNAINHGGDAVTIRVGSLPDGFFVADDGRGIPDDIKPNLFEFGYSGGSGTGLGLPIAKQIANAHGWSIAVSDSEDGGARIEITGIEHADTPG